MQWFSVNDTPLPGLKLVERRQFNDDRGFFSRLFCIEALHSVGFGQNIAQINHTWTQRRGSMRGLHLQNPPHSEAKFISCVRGAVFDVAVDLRRGSPTLLRWHAEVLSAQNMRSLMIPPGFAHGFQTLEDDCELLYLHSSPFNPQAEAALNARDPALEIDWPLPFADVSNRDAGLPFIDSYFSGI